MKRSTKIILALVGVLLFAAVLLYVVLPLVVYNVVIDSIEDDMSYQEISKIQYDTSQVGDSYQETTEALGNPEILIENKNGSCAFYPLIPDRRVKLCFDKKQKLIVKAVVSQNR